MNDQKNKGFSLGRRKKEADKDVFFYGKIPPQAKEIENAVLGTILLIPGAIEEANELLRPECFYVEAHQRIYRCMQVMSTSSQPIDILTVTEALKKTEELEMVGGAYYVTQLTNFVTGSSHLQNHCRILYEKYIKREIIHLGSTLVSSAYEDSSDAFELVELLEQSVQTVAQNNGATIKPLDALLVERFRHLHTLSQQDQRITGVPSGFTELDQRTHGWQPGNLIILAARPGVGKTALALNLARNAAKIQLGKRPPVKVGFFSLEMSMGELVDRVMSAESEVWMDKLQTGRLDEQDMKQVYSRGIQPLSQLGIYLDDTPGLNIYQLRSKARLLKRKHDVGLLIVDYLQLMSGTGENRNSNREQEISTISRNLKLLAKELQIPIIALSQLSRELEKRRGEKNQPRLSDLRESGAIEQDADVVMFLYRPEYYDVEVNESGESTHGLTEVTLAKNRHGKLATGKEAIQLRALLHIQKFVPWTGDLPTELGAGNWRPMETEKKDELPFE